MAIKCKNVGVEKFGYLQENFALHKIILAYPLVNILHLSLAFLFQLKTLSSIINWLDFSVNRTVTEYCEYKHANVFDFALKC